MTKMRNRPIFRPTALLLALALLLLPAMGLASPAQAELSISLEYTGPDGSPAISLAELVPYPGYENAFWLYVSPEAQSDPNALIRVTDLFFKYPGGFSLANDTPASTLFIYNADSSLEGQFLEFYGYGQNMETLGTFRLFVSLGAPQPEAPAPTVQPVDITVVYRDQLGNELAREPRTLQPGPNTVTPDSSRVPSNYVLSGQGEFIVTVNENGADQSEVTFTYQVQVNPVDITVVYRDQVGNELARETRTLQPGPNTVTPDSSRVPSNYVLSGQGEFIVTVNENGADQSEVTFTYQVQVNPVDITVVYRDQVGNELARETRTLQPGPNTVAPDSSRVPSNYVLSSQGEFIVTVNENGADQSEVTFTYQVQVNPVDITVVYRDQVGNELARETRTLQPGPNTVAPNNALVPEGHTLLAPLEQAVFVDENGANPAELVFTYQAPPVQTETPTDAPIPAAEVTVMFVDTQGSPVAGNRVYSVEAGTWEVPADPQDLLPGYTLQGAASQPVTVTASGAVPNIITFVYAAPAEATAVPIPDAQITILYQDQNGNPVADQQVLTLKAGPQQVKANPVNLLPGHTLQGQDTVEVLVDAQGAHPNQVVFTYVLSSPVSEPVNVPISYVDEAGNRVASDTLFTAGEGKHSVPAAPLDLQEGYALLPGEEAAKYVTITQNQATPDRLTFVYRRVEEVTPTPVPAPKAALVNVIYRNEAGEPLYSTTVPCKEGEETTIAVDLSRVDTAVYQLVGEGSQVITVDAAGNPSLRDVVFIFKDITVKTAVIPVHYRDVEGNTVAPSQEFTLTNSVNQVKADPQGLPQGYALQGASVVEVTLSPAGVPGLDQVVFTYLPPATATPTPTQTPEPTVLPFEVTTLDRYGRPTGNAINFRSSPDSNREDNILGVVKKTDLAHILGSVTNAAGETWYLAEINGQEGFIWSNVVNLLEFNEVAALFGWTPQPSASPTPSMDPMVDGEIIDRWAEVSAKGGVNFRARPTTSSTLLGKLNMNDRIWVYTQQTVGKDVWFKVMANGKTGFVMASYLRLFSEQESQQYQVQLATPMPYAASPTPTVAPETQVPATATPTQTASPTATDLPQAYYGPALITRQTALRTGVSRQDELVMDMLDAETLVQVWSQTWVGNEGWSRVQVMATKMEGYVPNASLRYLTEQEANYYLSLLTPQASATPVPTRQPDQRVGYSIVRFENVPLRAFPDTNAQIMALMPESAVVSVHGQDYTAGTTWEVVQYNSYFGYVRSDQLRPLSAGEEQAYLDSLRTPVPSPVATLVPVTVDSPSSYGYVNTDRVILRSQPSTNSTQLKLMNKNAFALVYSSSVESDGVWYHVSQDGTTGYVRGDFFNVLPMGQLSTYLQSPEYLNANPVTGTQTSGQQTGQITPLESYNATVWQNPNLITASYEPFNPLGTPTPAVEAIVLPSASPTPSPTPALQTVAGFEDPDVKPGGFNALPLVIGALVLLGGGGYYAYHLYNQNQKRAAARAAQRRQQAARQAGQPQARPAQPSPYAPPQGTAQYRPQGTPGQPPVNPTQGTAQYRPQGTPGQPPVAPTQGTAQYRPQGTPGQPPVNPTQGTAQYRPQGTPGQPPVAPTQGTAQYRPQGTPGQPPVNPTQGTAQYRPQGTQGQPPQEPKPQAPAEGVDAAEQARRRRSDRFGNS